jgi:hypothetical protein
MFLVAARAKKAANGQYPRKRRQKNLFTIVKPQRRTFQQTTEMTSMQSSSANA